MKKRNLILGLALTLTVGLGITAYAATNPDSTLNKRLGLCKITGVRGYESMTSVLKDKAGVTDADITNARNSGKTLYALAEEKGLSSDELKAALIEEKSKAIDEAVKAGSITAEQGASLKESLKTNIASCTGSFGQMRKGNGGCGMGMGRNGGGKGLGNCTNQVAPSSN